MPGDVISDVLPDVAPDVMGDGFAQSVASILGPARVLDYDARYYTPGTAPDVAAAANQAALGEPDVAQATEGQRPHSATDGDNLAYWDFTKASLQYLQGQAASDYTAIGAAVTTWVVASFKNFSGNQCPVDLSDGAVNRGVSIFTLGNNLYARVITQGAGQRDIVATGWGATAGTGRYLMEINADGDGWTFDVFGAVAFSGSDSPVNAAIAFGNDYVTLGSLVGGVGGYHFNGGLYRVIHAVSVTADQRAAVRALLQSRYQIS